MALSSEALTQNVKLVLEKIKAEDVTDLPRGFTVNAQNEIVIEDMILSVAKKIVIDMGCVLTIRNCYLVGELLQYAFEVKNDSKLSLLGCFIDKSPDMDRYKIVKSALLQGKNVIDTVNSSIDLDGMNTRHF